MKLRTLLACLLFSFPAVADVPKRPVVVELFTSQGCANCPAADAILKKIATNNDFLPLSFHVTYFDKQGWKDPYSTKENTHRQAQYVVAQKLESVFTPQLVVDGETSVVGSNSKQVAAAIDAARKNRTTFPLSAGLNDKGDALDVRVGDKDNPLPQGAKLYEVHFTRSVVTSISGGDNRGKTLENINNVVAFFPLPLTQRYLVPLSSFTEDGVAYLLQDEKGKMLGAAYYVRN